MLRLLKAGFRYNRTILVLPFGLGLTGIVANIITGWENVEIDLPGVRSLMAVGTMGAYFYFLYIQVLEKRDRYHTMLPLSVREIGASRLLFLPCIWLSLVVLFFFGSSSVRPYRVDKIVWETLSLCGFVFIANAIFFINRDLSQFWYKKFQRGGLMILYAFVIILGYILFYFIFAVSIPYFKFLRQIDPFKENFENISSSPFTALLLGLLGIGFMGLSIVLFGRRNSYLE